MTTTYTADGGIKKIGTGLEAGTWGSSTNENFERIIDMIGGSTSIDVDALPQGSTSATLDGVTNGQFVLLDAADSFSLEDGYELRNFAIDFTDGAGATADITVEIYGDAVGTKTDRVLLIRNGFTANFNLIIKSGTSAPSVTIPQGFSMLVLIRATNTGATWLAGAYNLLSEVRLQGIDFLSGSDGINFTSTVGQIVIPNGVSPALTINDGTDNYIRVDTTAGVIRLGGPGTATTVDLSNGGTHTATFTLDDDVPNALVIEDLTLGDGIISVNTTTDAKQVLIGDATADDATHNVTLVMHGDITTENRPTTVTVIDDQPSALDIADQTANGYLTLDSTTGELRVDVGQTLTAPDIHLSGPDGYILGAEVTDLAGYSTGYGFRNNAGEMELKATTNETWGGIYGASNASGDTVYFKSGANLSKGTGTLGTGNSYSTEAHGLARAPRLVVGKLVCIVNDNGYVIGDEVHPSFVSFESQLGLGAGIAYGANATNVFYSTPSGALKGVDKSSGSQVELNKGRWDFYIECWE